jgi:hypothetical protein
MFSKRWTRLIILLFLAMLIPIILYNYAFDTVEGNVALATACANGTGAVGACGKLKASADEATKAQAALMANLKKKADDKAKAAAPVTSKTAAPVASKAAAPVASKAAAPVASKATAPAVSKDEAEEDSELAELFTVNNGTGDFAYAYALEPFYEGVATKATPATAPNCEKKLLCSTKVCKIFKRLNDYKKDSKKLEKYIDGKLTKWSDKNCK